MSGTGDRNNAWRRGPNPSVNQRPNPNRERSSGGGAGTSGPSDATSGGRQQRQSGGGPQAPNAWGQNKGNRGGGAAGSPAPAGTQSAKTASPAQTTGAAVGGFNRDEVRRFMMQGYERAVRKDSDQKITPYKSKSPTPAKASPWATKPGAMATGQDFWLNLRKQVAGLDHAAKQSAKQPHPNGQ